MNSEEAHPGMDVPLRPPVSDHHFPHPIHATEIP